jgi:hypothetical protein
MSTVKLQACYFKKITIVIPWGYGKTRAYGISNPQ